MNQEKIITDNVSEIIRITWDGERYALMQKLKISGQVRSSIWNPKEGHAIKEFIEEVENLEELCILMPERR